MEVVKGESVRWTKSSTGFVLLIFSLISSITLLIWSIYFSKYGTFREVVPLDWLSGSAFPPLSFWFWAYPSAYPSRCCLRLISLNSWFWWVNSTMAAAMDCICWMEGGCVTGADWWSRWGFLEASLLSWWPGLVPLILSKPYSLLLEKDKTTKLEVSPFPQTAPTNAKCSGFNGLIVVMKDCKYEHTIKRDQGGPVKHPPMAKLVFSKKKVLTFLEVKSQNALTLVWFRPVLI